MNYQLDYLKTMPEIFADALLGGTDRKLLNVKRNDEWVSFTYQDVNDTIPRIGFGFYALGLKQKDRVGLLSENRPEWNMTDWACAHFNFTSVPVYHTCIPKQIEFILNHAEIKVLIVSSKEQADKVIAIKSALKTLKYMIILNDEKFDDKWIISWEDFLKKGDIAKEESKTSMQEIAAKVKPEDLYSIIYTSGTSGDPKGVMISQFNMASNVQQSQAALGFKKDKKWLSFLPLSHSFERVTSLFSTWIGAEIYFAESIAKVAGNLKEVQPQYMTTAPRLLEKVYAKKLVFNKIGNIFGGEFIQCVSGGAPLSEEVGEFIMAAGISIIEGYGLTEMSPVTHVNTVDHIKWGTVGKALPDVITKIAEDGEILLNGPNRMKQYFNNPEETAEAIDKDGWFHTGDIGFVDEEGFLKITDRKKNIIVTAGGKNIAPAGVEREICSSKFIDQAVVVGDRRKYLVAILVPTSDIFAKWGKLQDPPIELATYEDVSKSKAVEKLITEELEAHQQDLARYEQIKYFFIAPQPFAIETGELTASMKIKRKHIIEKYSKEIEKLYNN